MRPTAAKISHGVGFQRLMATVCLRFGKLFGVGLGVLPRQRREASATARIHDKAKRQALHAASSHRFAGRVQETGYYQRSVSPEKLVSTLNNRLASLNDGRRGILLVGQEANDFPLRSILTPQAAREWWNLHFAAVWAQACSYVSRRNLPNRPSR